MVIFEFSNNGRLQPSWISIHSKV